MGFEIELKFPVAHDGWRSAATHSCSLRDGLIGRDESGNEVRLRVDQERAWIIAKSARIGLERSDFTYMIPPDDAEEMLRTLCHQYVLEDAPLRPA